MKLWQCGTYTIKDGNYQPFSFIQRLSESLIRLGKQKKSWTFAPFHAILPKVTY